MKNLTFALVLMALNSAALAETCKMTLPDINKVIVAKELKHADAQAKAMEACVELRTEKYTELRGPALSEERYDEIINNCSLKTCEN